jgi:multidrug efflux pump subunit AcrA (membrane-fusion protein)
MAVNLRLKWIVFILLFMGMLVPGCKESSEKLAQEKKRESIVTATSHVRISHLYFKGVLQPIRNIPVISAIDGIIKRVLFKYGAEVKKGQVLVTVKATGLAEKYRQSVSDFLQKKSAVETAKTKRDGDEQLYKAGVISTEEVTASRNAYATSVLNLAQTRFELEKLLKEVGIRAATIEKLRLGEIKDVAKILVRTFSDLPVHSPASGVVLIPVEQKSSDSGSAQSNKLEQGTTIKTQQRILSLGDLLFQTLFCRALSNKSLFKRIPVKGVIVGAV